MSVIFVIRNFNFFQYYFMNKLHLAISGKIVVFLLTGILTSCLVSKKKLDDMTTKKVKAELEREACNDSLIKAKKMVDSLFNSLSESQNYTSKLRNDSTKQKSLLDKMNKIYSEEAQNHEKLKKDYKELLDISTAEAGKLNNYITKKEHELITLENRVNKLSQDLKAREIRVQELEEVLANKDKAVKELKTKVSNALLSFKDKDLTITVKNGKVYVSLAEQLLFKSGSTKVDEKGVEALKKLSGVLKEQKEINVMVEGHTDDVPIVKGTNGMVDNWDLSVLRATAITRILTNEGVQAQKITPSGKGEFSPISEAKTAEARQKNRRTEIILTPKLDELFKILDNN